MDRDIPSKSQSILILCLLLLEFKLLRSRDKTLVFKKESIVVREKNNSEFYKIEFHEKRDQLVLNTYKIFNCENIQISNP